MKKYRLYFTLTLNHQLQYRAAVYAGVLTQFFWGLLQILLYHALYISNPAASPMTLEQLASYFWLQQAFMTLFMTWFLDQDILDMIATGNIAYELCRPIDLYNVWFVKSMSNRFSKALLRFFPILIAASLLPKPYKFLWTQPPLQLIFFSISLISGFLVVVAFTMLIYVLTMLTLSPIGLRIVALSLMEFLSGGIIPLPFLPDHIRRYVEWLPFASMQNTPFRIYSGHISGSGVFSAIGLQWFWLVILLLVGKVLMQMALRHAVVQGG
ncbi:MAG: ABC transporter permease [Clostridia bacterium]|nr:ABC transporter permease [Clostridia bacterium]